MQLQLIENKLKSSLQKIKEIKFLEDDVRTHINITRYQNELIKDIDKWNQICCSLDTIGDTLFLVDGYLKTEYPKDIGLKYIYTYGLLQALVVQQDAISFLSQAFNVKYKRSKRALEIRNYRNSSIGHPIKQNQDILKKGKIVHNYLSRMTLSKDGFTLMRCYDSYKTEFVDINVICIIDDNLTEIKLAYEKVTNTLKEADKMHKEKYKNKPLVDSFSSGMNYYFEKISQGIHSPNDSNRSFGLNMLNLIIDVYTDFEISLKERGDIKKYTQYDLDEYKYALSKIKDYLSNTSSKITEQDARIFNFYVYENHKHFLKLAEEIDNSYNN